MNINDFSILYKSFLDGEKHPGFDKSLALFDSALFAKLTNEKFLPEKKFLLENLTPSSAKFILDNYNLSLSELCDIRDYMMGKMKESPELEINKAFLPYFKKSLSFITHNDLIRITRKDSYLFDLFLSLSSNQKNMVETPLIKLSYNEWLSLINRGRDSFVYLNFIQKSIFYSISDFTEDEIRSLVDKKMISASFFEEMLGNQINSLFENKLLLEVVGDTLVKSKAFRELFIQMLLGSKKNKSFTSESVQLLLSKLCSIQDKDETVYSLEYIFNEIDLNFVFSNKIRLSNGVFNLNTNLIDFCSENFQDYLSGFSDKEKITILSSFVNKEDGGNFNIQQYIDFVESVPVALPLEAAKKIVIVLSDINLKNLLDEVSSGGVITLSPLLNIVENPFGRIREKIFREFVEWQELNPEATIIDWSDVYSGSYSLDSSILNAMGDDLIRRFARVSIKNILTVPNGGLFNLKFTPFNDKWSGDDSIKWLAYSPDSPILEPFFKEITNNNSILYAKLILRFGTEDHLLSRNEGIQSAILKLAFNSSIYRDSLAVMFPFFDFSSMSMGSLKGATTEDNFFVANPFSCNTNFQKAISQFNVSYDTIDEYVYSATDEEIITYLKVANREFLPESLLEEAFDRDLYLLPGMYSFFFGLAEDIVSLKLIDVWRKKANHKVLKVIEKENLVKYIFNNMEVWDFLFLLKDWEELGGADKAIAKTCLACFSANKKAAAKGNEIWISKRFKRTVQLLKNDLVASSIFKDSSITSFSELDIQSFVDLFDNSHESVFETFYLSLIKQVKSIEKDKNGFAWIGMVMNWLNKLFLLKFKSNGEKFFKIVFEEIIEIFPELLYLDEFCSNEMDVYINELSFEKVLMLTESAVSHGALMSGEFVCRDSFKQKHQKAIYNTSNKDIELIRAYPVAFAFLNLLVPLADQKSLYSGWSLALGPSTSQIFLTGIKKIVDRLDDTLSKDNFNVLEGLVSALKNGGDTFGLIKRQFLFYIKENHLPYFLFFVDRLGDDDNILSDVLTQIKRKLTLEAKVALFEELFLSIKMDKSSGEYRSIIPLDDIYRDRNVCSTYGVLYYSLTTLFDNVFDLSIITERLKWFVGNYPTIYRDVYLKSTYPYLSNLGMHLNFFTAISFDIIDSSLKKIQIEKTMNKFENFQINEVEGTFNPDYKI